MTHSTPDEDPAELIRAVSDLAVMVERQSAVLAQLSDETRANTEQTDVNSAQTDVNTAQSVRNTSSNKRHRIALTIGGIGLVLDMLLSGLFIYQHEGQNCTNTRSERFFTAERAKVAGQIKGVDQISPRDPSVAADPRAGVEQFRHASQDYLDTISRLGKC